VYASSSIGLATLEILVNLENVTTLQDKYIAYPLEFTQDLVQYLVPDGDFSRLPEDWAATPHPLSSKTIGDEWVNRAESPILAVPSAVIPLEVNYVLNPAHPDFSKITIQKGIPYPTDQRLRR
jgi:RES domain-containing protein